jgi:ribokinase
VLGVLNKCRQVYTRVSFPAQGLVSVALALLQELYRNPRLIAQRKDAHMPSVTKPIVVVGSINTDLVVRAGHIPLCGETVLGSDFQINAGGKGANQAVAVARLGYPVRLIGQLGSDLFGTHLKEHLTSAGVDVSSVGRVEGSSGVALIVVAASGDNSIVVAPCANSFVSPAFLDHHIDTIRSAGAVLTQLEIPLETVVHLAEICADANVPLILDPAPAREIPASTLKQLTWFTPNETEAAFFAGDAGSASSTLEPGAIAASILAKGISRVVLKMGARGAYLATSTCEEQIEPFHAEVVDTTAAGDAFNGAFAMSLMLGKTPIDSARFAAAAGAICVTRKGAQSSMPAIKDVEHLLRTVLATNGRA